MDDPHDLQRFVQAQAPVYAQVLDELRAGVKRSHWIWFVFPQLAGLGFSAMARHYAIASLDEAQAYLAHPLLGARLRECAELVLAIEGRSIHDIFGAPDDLKFHSSMTLFGQAQSGEAVFQQCLQKYFAGQSDAQTIALLGRAGGQAA
ncbi:MAG: DUF1810 domain-containing protein [Ramlibacter sp.]|nr:DUF1810 domain-containing protein [Ramlibacter sp.]